MKTDLAIRQKLVQWIAEDHASGIVRELAEYQERFPGYEELVAEEIEALAAPEGPHEQPRHLAPGSRFGRFRVVRALGRGGQATVVMAVDTEDGDRTIALKVMHPGTFTSQGHARLESEAQRLRELGSHPSVCALHEVGVEQGLPFLSMDYVRGRTLESWIEEWSANPRSCPADLGRRATSWLAGAARALDFAHRIGVVHRDIKASNLVLDIEQDHLVVVDFGLAKDLREEVGLTRSQDAVGTLDTMAPEQTLLDSATLDGRTDIYALGLVLYRVLALDTPRPRRAPDGSVQVHVLPRMGELTRRHGRDASSVIRTACAPRREDRYSRAADLALELDRLSRGEPVRARPPSLNRQFRDWVRSSPQLALAAAVVLGTFGLAFAVTQVLLRNAQEARTVARHELYEGKLLRAREAFEAGRAGQALSLLEEAEPALRGFEWQVLRGRLQPQGRHVEPSGILDMAVVGGACWLALGSGEVVRLDGEERTVVQQVELLPNQVLRIDPTQRTLLRVDRGGPDRGPAATVLDLADGGVVAELDLQGIVKRFTGQYRPDGGVLLLGRNSQERQRRIEYDPGDGFAAVPVGPPLEGALHTVRMDSASRHALLHETFDLGDGRFGLYDWQARQRLHSYTFPGRVVAFEFGPRTDSIYVTWFQSPDYRLALLSPRGGAPLREIDLPAAPWALAVSPSGRYVAVSCEGGAVLVHDELLGRRVGTLGGATERLQHLAFTSEGRLVGAGAGGGVVWWDGPFERPVRIPTSRESMRGSVLFSPDSRYLTWGRTRGPHRWVDLASGEVHEAWCPSSTGPSFQGGEIYLASRERWRVTCSPDAEPRLHREPGSQADLPIHVSAETGEVVGWTEEGFEIRPFVGSGAQTFELGPFDRYPRFLVTRDRALVATAVEGTPWLQVHDRRTQEVSRHPLRGVFAGMAHHPTLPLVAVGFEDGTVQLVHLESGRTRRFFTGQSGAVDTLAFDPVGTRLVGGQGRVLHFWDRESERRLISFDRQIGYVSSVAFSPNGRMLAIYGQGGGVEVWMTSGEEGQSWGHEGLAAPPLAGDYARLQAQKWNRGSLYGYHYPDSAVADRALRPMSWYELVLDHHERIGSRTQALDGLRPANLWIRLGEYEKAADHLETLTAHRSFGSRARVSLSMAQAFQGNLEEAQATLDQVSDESIPMYLEAQRIVSSAAAREAIGSWQEGALSAEDTALVLGAMPSVSPMASGLGNPETLRAEARFCLYFGVTLLQCEVGPDQLAEIESWCRRLLELGSEDAGLPALLGLCIDAQGGDGRAALPPYPENTVEPALLLSARAYLGLKHGDSRALEHYDSLRRFVASCSADPPQEVRWLLERCRAFAVFF